MKSISSSILLLFICLLNSVSYAKDNRPATESHSKLSILIDVPINTPRDTEIYITGNFEGWSGGTTKRDEYRARYVSPGKYTIELTGKPNEEIEFKFSQGNWVRIEVTADGGESAARSYVFTDVDEQIVQAVDRWSAYLEKAIIDSTPANRRDGLIVGELGVDGGNKDMIITLAQDIAEGKYDEFDSLLIAHKGKLIFESYYRAGNIDLRHFQASATKAYTGLALGRAIQLGYLTMADLDKPFVSFLKDLDSTKFAEGVEKITLNHALTMRSGIRITKDQEQEIHKNPIKLKGQGKIQALLEHTAPITAESQSFKYGGGPELVLHVIEAVVPGGAKDFIKKELLDKMGITNYQWRTNEVTGLPEAGWKTKMTSRDMLKWGALAMGKGKWNGEQLIPEAFIAKATSRILYTGDDDVYGGGKDVSNQGYGYFWWSADLKYGNKSYFAASAQGGGGQFIILIEEFDLLVVVTAHDNDNSTLQITAERILPAFIQ